MPTIETNPQLGEQVRADAKEFVLHSWSVQNAINPLPVAGAEGRYFWDYEGNRYLDFASQLVNVSIGHQHPKIIAAIKEQADKLCTIGPPMATEPRSQLGRMLAEVTPGNLKMSFFTNGGAEANENAIKLARWYTGRQKIVARYRSYHGATAGAITLTGDPRRWPAERRAGLGRHRRPDRRQLLGLLLDRRNDLRMAVADRHVHELRGEVEVALAVVVPEVAALGAGDGNRVDCVLHRPGVEDELLRVRLDLRAQLRIRLDRGHASILPR